MRAIIDTNILVRALIMPHGSVGPVLQHLRQGDYIMLYAPSLLAELVDVLSRPRIRTRYGLSDEDIKTVLRLILLRSEAVTPTRTITACRDPKDNKFLEVAVAGQAEVIVSGDEDLLVLHPFEGIPIISPAEFLKLLDDQAVDKP
jgi:putative PIN family toxin of toxin-antitoxin system